MTPARLRASADGVFDSTSASSRCSVETYWSLSLSASRMACFKVASSWGATWVDDPLAWGREASFWSTSAATPPVFAPSLPSAEGTTPPSCASRDFRRCSGDTSGWSLLSASDWADANASWAFTVNWSIRMLLFTSVGEKIGH